MTGWMPIIVRSIDKEEKDTVTIYDIIRIIACVVFGVAFSLVPSDKKKWYGLGVITTFVLCLVVVLCTAFEAG